MRSIIANVALKALRARAPIVKSPLSYNVITSARAQSRRLSSASTAYSEPVGVKAALRASADPSFKPRATLLQREFSLAGRVAVVTGGYGGIGLEVSEGLAEAGATVYCVDIASSPTEAFKKTREYVRRIAEEDESIGRLETVQADVTNAAGISDVLSGIADKEGRLDICIAAAGVAVVSDARTFAPEALEQVMRVNTHGVLYTAQAAARTMEKHNSRGSIVLIGSVAGSVSLPRGGARKEEPSWLGYCASKAAVIQIGRSLACDLAPKGIRVNTVSPGIVNTPYGPYFLGKRDVADFYLQPGWILSRGRQTVLG